MPHRVYVYKQLLDEAFVMSRIMKGEVSVISRSRRLRLITLTSAENAYRDLDFSGYHKTRI